MNLVVGSTGVLGTEICRRLRERNLPVRALVRETSDAAKIGALRAMGCEIATGDLQDQSSLERACQGVLAVISTATTVLSRQPHDSLGATDLSGHVNLIDAARKGAVRRFILISLSGNLQGESGLHKAKRTVEEKLRTSNLTYTILRPSAFMEMWLSPAFGWDFANGKVQILGDGECKWSYISFRDVAAFAVESLTNPAAENAVIDIGGPRAVSPNEAVKIFEKALGRKLEVTRVPEEALRQQYQAAADEYQKTFASLMLGACGSDEIEMKETLRRFPLKLTSVEDYARSLTSTERR